MALQAKVVLQGGVEVPDAYIRTHDVSSIKKDREGTTGFYCTYGVEVFKDKATADAGGQSIQVPELDRFKMTNLETLNVSAGNLVGEALGIIYGDLKQRIVDLGWEAATADIEDV
jgi:hypothetical protein